MKYEQHDVSPRTPEIFRAAGIGNALGWFDWKLYATVSLYLANNLYDKACPSIQPGHDML